LIVLVDDEDLVEHSDTLQGEGGLDLSFKETGLRDTKEMQSSWGEGGFGCRGVCLAERGGLARHKSLDSDSSIFEMYTI
jgi:hypothetical protein